MWAQCIEYKTLLCICNNQSRMTCSKICDQNILADWCNLSSMWVNVCITGKWMSVRNLLAVNSEENDYRCAHTHIRAMKLSCIKTLLTWPYNTATLKPNGAKEQNQVCLLPPHSVTIIIFSFFFISETKVRVHICLLCACVWRFFFYPVHLRFT